MSYNLNKVSRGAFQLASALRHEFIMPEHILYIISHLPAMATATESMGGSIHSMIDSLKDFFVNLETVPPSLKVQPRFSEGSMEIISKAMEQEHIQDPGKLDLPALLRSMASMPHTRVQWFLENASLGDKSKLIARFKSIYRPERNLEFHDIKGLDMLPLVKADIYNDTIEDYFPLEFVPTEDDFITDENYTEPMDSSELASDDEEEQEEKDWHDLVVDITALLPDRNPLIGREVELERTIQVLCRKDKNNALHIGEPGVGKTALVYGLAAKIVAGDVPPALHGARIYQMEMGSLVAGTQYRGDFEKKLDLILKGASKEKNIILYIDEIHTIMGAGAIGNSSLDASNILKRYMEENTIRFIGSTTFEENNKYFSKNKAISRRFRDIEIKEPSVEETVEILEQLKPAYERFHGVSYSDDVMRYAVDMSVRYMRDRFLPDKAIDLIDEAGAYRQLHPGDGAVVDKELISEVVSKISRVESVGKKEEGIRLDLGLEKRILSRVYGQDAVISDVVESILISRAGLNEGEKPLGSFLFVGPTGVGKTELARTLAEELGIGLVRFDMSEYAEKHAVAKLIGAPAGYVGYEDGGLLTAAVRNTPDCVVLLDEIEKAHPDIYNILLQVMDYGTLTDNQGRKADFSNVILIMTSNAGAQYASQAGVGFGGKVSRGEGMLKEVRRVFKPEFLNRLNGVEVFNDMDRTMASRILDRNLKLLNALLGKKHVELTLTSEAREEILKEGFSPRYGARELQRILEKRLKRPLTRELLFGRLKNGGKVTGVVKNGDLFLEMTSI